jgi:hypothetical protein
MRNANKLMEKLSRKNKHPDALVNVMMQMRSKINERVLSSLPPISAHNESKLSRQNASVEKFQELEAGRSHEGFKELSR